MEEIKRKYNKTLPTEKKINLYLNEKTYTYIKTYAKQEHLTQKVLYSDILELGWESYKKLNNINL